MNETFLRIDNVSKAYDDYLAVNQVSLNIPKGKIYGLLGPNGAGKTSTIRMITRITVPDSGTIYFNGEELAEKHSRDTGYMPEERGLYKKMKVLEQITYLLSLKGLPTSEAKAAGEEWLERLGLTDWSSNKVTDLSKGMQQKVQFISTIAHKPRLLILDEPFSGLDPVNTKLIEKEIFRLKDEGTTIIFSTHRMEQVEELCDYIALMSQGKLMLENEITQVRKDFQKQVYHISFLGDKQHLMAVPGLQILEITDKQAKVELSGGEGDRNDLLRRLADSPLEILSFALHLPRLNEIFIELVGGNKNLNSKELA